MIAVIISLFQNQTRTPKPYARLIENLRKQTFKDFMVVAIDDGSKDDTPKIMQESGLPLHMIQNGKNIGLTRSLIKSIKWARNSLEDLKYIVVHDADDFSREDRLGIQHQYMEEHQDVSILNSSVLICDKGCNVHSKKKTLTTHDEIIDQMKDRNPLFHSAVMTRSNIFDTVKYNRKHKYAQDYGLWTLCAMHGFRFAGIDEPLVTRCKHKRSLSMKWPHHSIQRHLARQIKHAYNQWLLVINGD